MPKTDILDHPEFKALSPEQQQQILDYLQAKADDAPLWKTFLGGMKRGAVAREAKREELAGQPQRWIWEKRSGDVPEDVQAQPVAGQGFDFGPLIDPLLARFLPDEPGGEGLAHAAASGVGGFLDPATLGIGLPAQRIVSGGVQALLKSKAPKLAEKAAGRLLAKTTAGAAGFGAFEGSLALYNMEDPKDVAKAVGHGVALGGTMGGLGHAAKNPYAKKLLEGLVLGTGPALLEGRKPTMEDMASAVALLVTLGMHHKAAARWAKNPTSGNAELRKMMDELAPKAAEMLKVVETPEAKQAYKNLLAPPQPRLQASPAPPLAGPTQGPVRRTLPMRAAPQQGDPMLPGGGRKPMTLHQQLLGHEGAPRRDISTGRQLDPVDRGNLERPAPERRTFGLNDIEGRLRGRRAPGEQTLTEQLSKSERRSLDDILRPTRLRQLSLRELQGLAKEHGVEQRTAWDKKTKPELVDALTEAKVNAHYADKLRTALERVIDPSRVGTLGGQLRSLKPVSEWWDKKIDKAISKVSTSGPGAWVRKGWPLARLTPMQQAIYLTHRSKYAGETGRVEGIEVKLMELNKLPEAERTIALDFLESRGPLDPRRFEGMTSAELEAVAKEYGIGTGTSTLGMPAMRLSQADLARRLLGAKAETATPEQLRAHAEVMRNPEKYKRVIALKRLIRGIGRKLVKQGRLAPEDFERHSDRYLMRLYANKLADKHGVTLDAGAKLTTDYLKQKGFTPKEIRLIQGEIRDLGYLAAKTVGIEMRDIALHDFMETLVQHDVGIIDYSSVTEYGGRWYTRHQLQTMLDRARATAKSRGLNTAEGELMAKEATRLEQIIAEKTSGPEAGKPSDYREIPRDERYGPLQGLRISKDVYNDVVGQLETVTNPGWGRKFLDAAAKGHSWFKVSKVLFNPPTQARNLVSNVGLMMMSGMSSAQVGKQYAWATREMVRGKQSTFLNQLKARGIDATTFNAQEIRVFEKVFAETNWASGVSSVEVIQRLATGLQKTVSGGRKTAAWSVDKAGRLYQAIETAGKLAKARDVVQGLERDLGRKATPEEYSEFLDHGVREANKWLIDYSLVPQAVKSFRKHPFGGPFVTFQYKTLPLMVETAMRRPWIIAAAALAPRAMMWAARERFDLSDEDVKILTKMRSEHMRRAGHVWFLPYRNPDGTWRMLDIGYMAPWGGLSQAGKALGEGKPIRAAMDLSGVFGGPTPQIITALTTNRDTFTGREIIDTTLSPRDRFWQGTEFAYNMAMPSWVTDKGFAGKLYDAFKQEDMYSGGTQTFGKAAGSLVGVNLTDFDPAVVQANAARQFKYDVRHLKSLMRRNPDRSSKYRDRIIELSKGFKQQYGDRVPRDLRSRRRQ